MSTRLPSVPSTAGSPSSPHLIQTAHQFTFSFSFKSCTLWDFLLRNSYSWSTPSPNDPSPAQPRDHCTSFGGPQVLLQRLMGTSVGLQVSISGRDLMYSSDLLVTAKVLASVVHNSDQINRDLSNTGIHFSFTSRSGFVWQTGFSDFWVPAWDIIDLLWPDPWPLHLMLTLGPVSLVRKEGMKDKPTLLLSNLS